MSLRSILYRRSILYSSQKDTNGVIFPTKKKLCYLNKYIRLWFLIHPIRLFYTKRLQETFPSIIFFFHAFTSNAIFLFNFRKKIFYRMSFFFFFFLHGAIIYTSFYGFVKKRNDKHSPELFPFTSPRSVYKYTLH